MSFESLYTLKNYKILGINPPVFDFACFDLWAKPLGLLNVLGYLREQGNDVFLLDALYEAREKPMSFGRWKVRREKVAKPPVYSDIPRHYYRFGLGPEEMRARLAALPRPDVILVTSIMTYWYPGVFETITLLKEMFPKIPVVLGGLYATLCPQHARRSGADYVMGGETVIPRPALVPLDLYEAPQYAILATSYGCPMRCRYCASSVINPHFTARPAADIFRDLAGQTAAGNIHDVAFYDDALLWERETRLYPLCEHIQKNYPPLNLHTPNGLSVAMLDETCCRVLRQTGFRTLRLSLEGIDRYTREAGSGKSGRRSYEEATANLRAAGYAAGDVETYILAGLPGQKLDDIANSILFVKSLGGRPKLCEFSPIPGAGFFAEALLGDPLLAAEPLRHNNSVYTAHISRRIAPLDLQALKSLCR